MKQLAMKAMINNILPKDIKLPIGYKFVNFNGSKKQIDAWKKITTESPKPNCSGDDYYRIMIEEYHEKIDKENDIWFIENNEGEYVATVTTITHQDGTGYVHMVKALEKERGKGLGQAMADFSIEEFRKRKVGEVYLTTDDFRVPAVKTYIKAGFLPIIYHDDDSDMEERWNKMFEIIGYEKTKYVYEEYLGD